MLFTSTRELEPILTSIYEQKSIFDRARTQSNATVALVHPPPPLREEGSKKQIRRGQLRYFPSNTKTGSNFLSKYVDPSKEEETRVNGK